ncbi:MAG: hypothetical protein QNJ58_23810 [Desulfobacterales bacterium]|nr:hypothetical protein [Desulfobacterales bacterium]
MELVIVVLLGAGAYVGWNIGANDTANCIGTTVGCGLISFRKAAILVAVFAIVGAVVGVGLVKGARAISKKTIATILVGWVLTPTMAGSFSFWLYKVLKVIWN